MLLSALLLATALAPQEAPPPAPAEVAPVEETTPASAPAPEMTASDAPAPLPGLAQASIDAGLSAYRKRRFAAAASQFRKATEADPSSAAAHYYLGYSIYKQAEPRRKNAAGKREALEEFSKAFALEPTFRPTWGVAK